MWVLIISVEEQKGSPIPVGVGVEGAEVTVCPGPFGRWQRGTTGPDGTVHFDLDDQPHMFFVVPPAGLRAINPVGSVWAFDYALVRVQCKPVQEMGR
jgi:hypothetical protein